MTNVNKTDIVYWLEKIFVALGGVPADVTTKEINKTDGVFWLEQIYEALGGKDKPQSVTDITALTNDQLDALKVGDKVAKVTGTARHLYTVSYKDAENGGICLTYTDAYTVETVAYDHTESGWSYNSTDKTIIGS